MSDETGYTFKRNKWWIDKDPDDELFYAVDIGADLALSGASIAGVTAMVTGVTVLVPAAVSGTTGVVKLGGLDETPRAVNSCTLRFTLSNTEQMDKTIHFKQRDK